MGMLDSAKEVLDDLKKEMDDYYPYDTNELMKKTSYISSEILAHYALLELELKHQLAAGKPIDIKKTKEEFDRLIGAYKYHPWLRYYSFSEVADASGLIKVSDVESLRKSKLPKIYCQGKTQIMKPKSKT